MALIVEDGTGVANANSYGTIGAARSYAVDRNITLSATDSVVSGQLVMGTDYLESFAQQFVGSPTSPTQALSWPRQNVMANSDTPFPSNSIPIDLIHALFECVIAQFNGVELQPSVDHSGGGFIIEEKVDVIDTKFSERIGTTSQPMLPKVLALLAGLLNPNVALRTVRV